MAPRFVLPTRLPARAFRAPARFNSNTSTSRTARVIEMASEANAQAQAQKPSALEAGVPFAWAVCGVLGYAAWNRVEEREGSENVGKVCCFPLLSFYVMAMAARTALSLFENKSADGVRSF